MGLPLSKYVWFDGKFVTLDKANVPITTHAIHYGTSVFEGIRAYWNGKNLYAFRLDEHIKRFKSVTLDKANVPITTHAIHYGTSVFEGIRAYWNGKNLYAFRLDEHIKRFRRSGQFYNISLNFSDKIISNAVIGICKKNKIKKSCYIRPFYFIGDYGINLHVTEKAPTNVAIFTFPFGNLFDKNGITAGVVSWRKFSDMSTPPQAKMGGNYLNSIIATQEARRSGFDEAILLDHNGNVSEAPGENIFIVKKGQLITPPLSSSALNGITRDAVIKIARDL